MSYITLIEILEILATTFVIGYLFSHFIRAPHKNPLFYTKRFNQLWNWPDLKYSMIVVGPAIILHEIAHKITAISIGFPSAFHGIITGGGIVWIGAVIGFVLRIIGSPFMFLIPGYVAPATATAWNGITAAQTGIIAFAGPAINLGLYLLFMFLLKSNKYPKYNRLFAISKVVNMWLFIFNMIPFGPLDGAKVLIGLKALVFGA